VRGWFEGKEEKGGGVFTYMYTYMYICKLKETGFEMNELCHSHIPGYLVQCCQMMVFVNGQSRTEWFEQLTGM
jgi:hypothetical protein